MNDYELIQIENAFEDLMGFIEEQDMSLSDALVEVAFIHDLDESQIEVLHKIVITLSRK
tara:strand:- start:282 stop:458 length:177 start_codon:yes stop_codon:yes gene_type:complete